MGKLGGIHACLGPSDLMGIATKLDQTWFALVLIPTFLLGIWHGCDWLKERFVSAIICLGGSWNSHTWLALSLINNSFFSLIFHM